MRIDDLDLIAPSLHAGPWSEAEVLGCAVWLWMHSPAHRDTPLQALPAVLLPAIKNRQFALALQDGRPVFYLAWAQFNADAEQRYLLQHPALMPEADWNCGTRLWFSDWIAPFGHCRQMASLVRERLFAERCGHMLYHRGAQRGMQARKWRGKAVTPEAARNWFAAHPLPSSLLPQGAPGAAPAQPKHKEDFA